MNELWTSCRLYLQAGSHHGAWLASTNDQNQWLQVKFAQRVEIRRVATQGRPNSDQWVTSYKLNYSSNSLLFYQYRTNKNQTVSSFGDVLSIPLFLQCRYNLSFSNLNDSVSRRDLLASLASFFHAYAVLSTCCSLPIQYNPLMSRIERKYCLISTSYLAGLFEIFILLHIWQNSPFHG